MCGMGCMDCLGSMRCMDCLGSMRCMGCMGCFGCMCAPCASVPRRRRGVRGTCLSGGASGICLLPSHGLCGGLSR